MSFEAIHCPGCCWETIWPEVAPPTFDVVAEEPAPAVEAPDMPEEPPEAVDAGPDDEVDGVSDCPTVDDPETPLPDPLVEEPDVPDWLIVDEPPEAAGLVPTVAPALGCMAEEPEVVDPDPAAAGRSVPPEGGAVLVWANAGGAASAVATRQAAICDFNIDCSPGGARRVAHAASTRRARRSFRWAPEAPREASPARSAP